MFNVQTQDQEYVNTLLPIRSELNNGDYYLDPVTQEQWRSNNQLAKAVDISTAHVSVLVRQNPIFRESQLSVRGIVPTPYGKYAAVLYPRSTFNLLLEYKAAKDAKSYPRKKVKKEAPQEIGNSLTTTHCPVDLGHFTIPGYQYGKKTYVALRQIGDLLDIAMADVLEGVKSITGEKHNDFTYDSFDEEVYRLFPLDFLASVFRHFKDKGNVKARRYA